MTVIGKSVYLMIFSMGSFSFIIFLAIPFEFSNAASSYAVSITQFHSISFGLMYLACFSLNSDIFLNNKLPISLIIMTIPNLIRFQIQYEI